MAKSYTTRGGGGDTPTPEVNLQEQMVKQAVGDSMSISLSKSDLMDIIREAKRPDPEIEMARNVERDRLAKRKAKRIHLIKMEETARKQRQSLCRHRKPNGEECVGGQTFSDGKVRIFCLRCQATVREYWTPEIAQGIAIARKMEKLGITDDDIKEAAEFSGVGDHKFDEEDPFALSVPKHIGIDLTTENTYK